MYIQSCSQCDIKTGNSLINNEQIKDLFKFMLVMIEIDQCVLSSNCLMNQYIKTNFASISVQMKLKQFKILHLMNQITIF